MRGFNLKKSMHDSDTNIVPLWKTFVLWQKKVILKILGYSRYTIWTPKSAKKVIAENSFAKPQSYSYS